MTNEELDKRVAELQGWELIKADEFYNWKKPNGNYVTQEFYHPTTNWQQAGELLEKYKVDVSYDAPDWYAECSDEGWCYADTPQVAIVKAVIALLELRDD